MRIRPLLNPEYVMRRANLITAVLAVFGVLSFASALLQAQTIRSYGDEGSGDSGGGGQQQRSYYPGQPVPQSNQGQSSQQQPPGNNQQQSENGENGEDQLRESYSIRIYRPGDYDGQSGASAKQERGTDGSSPVEKPENELYQGVIPGLRDTVAHLRTAAATSQSGPNPVTWIGFRAEDERTRVFIQTARAPKFSRHPGDDGRTLTIEIGNSELLERNFARRIDASRYDRVVERVRATETSDGMVAVRIDLKESASPEISTSDRYLYVDFPQEQPETASQSESARTDGSDADAASSE